MKKTYEKVAPERGSKWAGDTDLKHGLGRALKSYEVLSDVRAPRDGLIAGCCGYQKMSSVVVMRGVPKQRGGEVAAAVWRDQRDDVRYMPMPEDPYWRSVANQSSRSR